MPEDRIHPIAGLGNPGEKYRLTRHNMGFMVVDRLAQAYEIPLDRRKFDTVFGRGSMGRLPVILAKPMTFMNRCGPAVRGLALFFGLGIQDILVIHDDADLVFGKLKIKEKGGDGGHNGVKSLVEACGDDAFIRLRIGIGRPPGQMNPAAYVLQDFDQEQSPIIQATYDRAADAIEAWLVDEIELAMSQFNGPATSDIEPLTGET